MSQARKKLLKDARVSQFAACELLLDLLFSATSTFEQKLDLEALWITACVMHNTMREVINNPEVDLGEPHLPEKVRLSMSRRAIADKTGLSRETVRRRTNKLIDEGILEAEPNGNVKLNHVHAVSINVRALNQVHTSIQNYVQKLAEHSVDMPMDQTAKLAERSA